MVKLPTRARGFTIVELLIVVVVIAILAAIAIVAYNGVTKRATESTMKTDLKSISKRLEVDKTMSSTGYPASLSAANEGKGLTTGTKSTLRYGLSGNGYCVSIRSQTYADLIFRIESSDGILQNGDCTPGVAFVAGSLEDLGTTDGPGSSALFNEPRGIVSDSSGNLFVADYWNHRIRKITPSHVVSTIAGSSQGFFDSPTGTSAQFNYPRGLAIDSSNNLYVADGGNNRIRKITPAGAVSTIAGSGTAGFLDHTTGASAQFNAPRGVAVDASGNVYVADSSNHRIRRITPAGAVSTVAGSSTWGYHDNTGALAQLRSPESIAVDASGNIYLSDYQNRCIRLITPAGVVTTIAGTNVSGYVDSPTGSVARFNSPWAIAISSAGDLYIADYGNNRIRKVTPAGAVTTVAGTGAAGATDGPAMSATFQDISGMAFTPSGSLYITDRWNGVVRKIEFL